MLLDDINYNTTENYYERGKYVIMIPIIINFLRLLLFYFCILFALCLNDFYKKVFSLSMLKVYFTFLCLSLCSSWIYLFAKYQCIGRRLGLNLFDICFLMLSFVSTLILMRASLKLLRLAKRRYRKVFLVSLSFG